MSQRNQRFNLGIGFELMPQTTSDQFRKDFPPYVDGLVRSLPGNYVTTPRYARKANDIYNFKPRTDDVYVVTFPKSGTTWMQELVWMVMNDCDFEKGRENMLFIRSPFLEMDYLLPPKIADKCNADIIARKTNLPFLSKVIELLSSWNIMRLLDPVVKSVRKLLLGDVMRDLGEIANMQSPRIIKSHLPFYLMNPTLLDTSKVIYVARNPKDVIVSYYYYHRILAFHEYTGDFAAFAEYFMRDEVYAAPYFPHVIDAWNKRHHPNMHFVFYEDLKKDLKGEIVKVCDFLGKQLSDEQLSKLTQHLTFDKFAKNDSVNMKICKDVGCMNSNGKFIRKGKTGDWKNHFTPELNQQVDAWIKTNLAGTDLNFITELDEQD